MVHHNAELSPSGPSAPQDPRLFALVSSAVSEALPLLRQIIAEGRHIPNRYPALERSELPNNGFPSFADLIFGNTPDFSRAFGDDEKALIRLDSLRSFTDLKAYILAHRRFQEFFAAELGLASTHALRGFVESRIGYGTAIELVEMYQVAFPDCAFSADKLLPLYNRIEERVFAKPIKVEFAVPILCLRFSVSDFSLLDGLSVRKMPDYLQHGLAALRHYESGTHRIVAGAATHALFVEGTCPNERSTSGLFTKDEIDYPLEQIDAVFSALRIMLGVSTGYAQVGVEQASWKELNYPYASRTQTSQSFRRYPAFFEDGYWLEDVPIIDDKQLGAVRALLQGDFGNGHFAIAKRRVNDWALRERPDDATIDALIGLESLLSDGQTTELTHKLALRAAALLSCCGSATTAADEIFTEIKKIYAYRSTVVHGHDASKIWRNNFNKTEWGPASAAYFYLRSVIVAQAANPRFCEAQTIDRELLLGVSHTEDTAR